MLSFIFDRIERNEVEEHVHQLAYIDQLTGIDNQYSFSEKVTEQIHGFEEGQRGVFLYLVMDQFTEVQGMLGPDGQTKCSKLQRIG